MSKEPTVQDQQLEALEASQTQQSEALSQMRSAALGNAQYWEDLAEQAEVEAPAHQPRPTTWVNAHFDYLDTVAQAQFEYARALIGGPGSN